MKKIILGLVLSVMFLAGTDVAIASSGQGRVLENQLKNATPRPRVEALSPGIKPGAAQIVVPKNNFESVSETIEKEKSLRENLLTIVFTGVPEKGLKDLVFEQLDATSRNKLKKIQNLGNKIDFDGMDTYINQATKSIEYKKINNLSAGKNSVWIKKDGLDLSQKKILLKISHKEYFPKILDATTAVKGSANLVAEMTRNPSVSSTSAHLTIGKDGYDAVLKDNIVNRAGGGFEGFENGTDAGNEDKILKNFFSNKNNGIMVIVLRVLGTIGILYLVIGGIRYIFSNGDEESVEKAKNQIIWALVGLIILSLAEFIGFEFINPYEKDVLGNEVANSLKDKVAQIIRVLEYIVGGLFLLNGVVSAYNLVTSRGQDENLDNEKSFIQTFIWGAGFILFAEVLIRIVASDVSRSEQVNIISSEIGGIVNFILTFFAGAALIMLIVSALYYVSSLGDEERVSSAKKLIRNSAVAFVIAFSSYVLAQFMIV